MRNSRLKMWRSATAMLLVFCMLFGLCGTSFAATPNWGEDNTVVYVSIGDSMTNGYGLPGYESNSGLADYGVDTYAQKFAAYLAGYTGAIEDEQVIFEGSNGVVDHRQLATSGFRAADLHWLLELDYTDNDAFLNDVVALSDRGSWHADNWSSDAWYALFATGDYRTNDDYVDPGFRLGQGAARILANYYNIDGTAKYPDYYTSEFATAANAAAAINGIASRNDFPGRYGHYIDPSDPALHLKVGAEYFQRSVADADVISLALGNTDMGPYMVGQLVEAMKVTSAADKENLGFYERFDIRRVYALADFSPELASMIEQMLNEVKAIAVSRFADYVGNAYAMEAVIDVLVYSAMNFIVNYIGSVDAIVAANNDVDIIQIALMNPYMGNSADEAADGISLGAVVGAMYTPINQFIAALPTYKQARGDWSDANFYYAEAPYVACMADVFGDDFYTVNGVSIKYPGLNLDGVNGFNSASIVRDRLLGNIVGSYFGMLQGVVSGLNMGVTLQNSINVATVNMYEMMTPAQRAATLAGANPMMTKDTAVSCAMYLALENATIRSGRGAITLQSLGGILGGMGDLSGVLAPVREKLLVNLANAQSYFDTALMLVYESKIPGEYKQALKAQLGISDVQLAYALYEGTYDSVLQAAMPEIPALLVAFRSGVDTLTSGLNMVMALPEALSNALYDTPAMRALLCLDARMNAADGIGAHPAIAGHDAVYLAITDSYDNDFTSGDQTKENLSYYANALYDFLANNFSYSTIEKIDLVEKLYSIIYGIGILDNYPEVAVATQIYRTLSEKGYVVAEQKMAIILKVYGDVLSGTADKNEIADFIYQTLIGNNSPANVTAIAEETYVILRDYGYLNDYEAYLPVLEALYKALGTVVSDEQLKVMVDCLYTHEIPYVASHGNYAVDDGSYYVALGNADYAADLAAALGLSAKFEKLPMNSNYQSAVTRADLVTVKFDNGEALEVVVNQTMGLVADFINNNTVIQKELSNPFYGKAIKNMLATKIDLTKSYDVSLVDWSRFDAAVVEAKNEVLSVVKGNLMKQGISAEIKLDSVIEDMMNQPGSTKIDIPDIYMPVLDYAMLAIENAIYRYFLFVSEFPVVLDEIREASPEAQVVVTSISNHVEEALPAMMLEFVDLSAYEAYMDYAVQLLNLHLFSYATLEENVTYVKGNDAHSIMQALAVAPTVSFDGDQMTVTLPYEVEATYVFAASYDETGKLLRTDMVPYTGGSAVLTVSGTNVRILYMNGAYAPELPAFWAK